MTLSLLAVFAHPDDEAGASGTMAKYARRGVRVALACATRGEVGEISQPALATPETLGPIREAELRAACAALGVNELRFLGYRDSGMAGAPENDDPGCFHQADSQAATAQLVGLIREIKPQVVITFEPYGGYGHPDHMAASRYTTAAFDLAGDPAAFPEAGQPWRPQRLFYFVLPRAWFGKLRQWLKTLEMDTSWLDELNFEEQGPHDDQITHIVDVTAQVETKWAALKCHQTQFGPDHFFHRLSPVARRELFSREHYIQARPAMETLPGGQIFDDLFVGQ